MPVPLEREIELLELVVTLPPFVDEDDTADDTVEERTELDGLDAEEDDDDVTEEDEEIAVFEELGVEVLALEVVDEDVEVDEVELSDIVDVFEVVL